MPTRAVEPDPERKDKTGAIKEMQRLATTILGTTIVLLGFIITAAPRITVGAAGGWLLASIVALIISLLFGGLVVLPVKRPMRWMHGAPPN